ncbi:hypothetical protein [Halorarius litoreus]|uniref:hypothetical protein n=1 Tax=Halorarius litoreus TaxID=2962676 RepID=UPI0020CE592D|nr:hypothetical protein [Halorarius litoreus]
MAEPNWPRHAVRIGVFEFRRSVRAIRRDRARAFLMALGLLFPSLFLVGLSYLLRDVLRSLDPVALPPVARGTVALFWLFGVFIATQRVVSARPRIDAEPLVLTTVSPRTTVGGLLVAETLRALAYLGLPVVVVTLIATYLFGTPVSLVAIPLAALLLGVTAVLVGMVLGYAIALLIATVPFVARHKTVLGGVAVLVAMGGYFLVSIPQFGGVDQAALAWFPMGWLADLAVVGTPVRGSVTRAGAVVMGSLLVVLVGGLLVEREATRLWFLDPVSGEPDGTDVAPEPATTDDGTALATAIRPVAIPAVIPQPTRRVAQWSVLRTRRDPRRLNFLLLPVVMVASTVVSSGLQTASLWMVVAPVAAVLLPWMAGATFAMNPFGDEGAVLPVTLLSISGSAYVRGLMVPGVLFGLPLVVLLVAGTGVAAGLDPLVGLALLGVALVNAIVAIATTPAVGLWFPRFSAISIGQSREVIPPRLVTTVLHFLAITVPGALLVVLVLDPALARAIVAGVVGFLPAALLVLAARGNEGALTSAGEWFQRLGTGIQRVDAETVQLVGGAALVVTGFVVALVSYRLAVRRFDRFSPPM